MTGNLQAFSTEEFQDRVKRVQERMGENGIDVLLLHSPENIYYLAGHQTSGYFAYQAAVLAQNGDPWLLLRYLERGNVDEYSWLTEAVTWKEGDDVVEKTLALLRAVGATIVAFPIALFMTRTRSEAARRLRAKSVL